MQRNTDKVKRQIAKEIKTLLEPEGAKSSTRIFTESEVKKFVEANHATPINEIGGIKDILEANYSEKTVKRLMSRIKKCVAWDTSICSIDTETLLNLFYKNDKAENVITSLTFDELVKLSLSETKDPNDSKNARILINCILQDTQSKYCNAVQLIQSNSYVDTQLIEFCEQNWYSLYTNDMCMALRAKSRQIDVQYFNQVTSPCSYIPNEQGLDVILEDDVFLHRSLIQVVNQAKLIGARKFLITRSFVEQLEKNKSLPRTKLFIYFLLADISEGKYTVYISETHSDISKLEILSKKYQAIIFTMNYHKAFRFKCNNISFSYISSWDDLESLKDLTSIPLLTESVTNYAEDSLNGETTDDNDDLNSSVSVHEGSAYSSSSTDFLADNTPSGLEKDEQSDAPESPNRFVTLLPSDDSHVLCELPLFNNNKKLFNKKRDLTEKIWAMDSATMEEIELKKYGAVGENILIIHCVNGLDGMYYINVYSTINVGTTLCGNLVFTSAYQKKDIPSIPREYRPFAERVILMT